MSILRKNFEISVWDDVWDSSKGKFIEKRIGVIGNQDMTSPCRAMEPSLTRNVNGTKKFTFKMYKYCRDEITGEKILNPFSEWLVNERKVKLKRGDTTYDFLIKNIQETSANYLYTYQLEDANITELSKNGYNVVLDTQAENNLGTLQKLAEFTLTDTDWEVESEKFVEKIEEGLVYLKVNTAFSAKQIKDQGTDYENGISVLKTTTIPKDSYILGFYSCCVNKPYRFQFLYFGSGDAVKQPWYQTTEKRIPIARNDKRIVDVENCQYYFDIPTDGDYSAVTTDGYTHFILPKQVALFNPSSLANADTRDRYDTLVSSWYRGERYGFVQDQIYSAKLDKYLNVYGANGDIYGYYETEYHSPILINNTITGPEFDSTTGWKIAQFGAEVEKIKIEPVQGRFLTSGGFVSSQEELKTGAFSTSNKYAHYLKLTLPKNTNKDNVVVLNTGIYDNRTTIENFEAGDIWALRCDYRIGNTEYSYPGTGPLVFDLSEYTYLTKQGYYQKEATQNIVFSSATKTGTNGKTYKSFTVSSTAYTKEDFKKDCKLYVSFGSNTTYNVDKEVYIKDIQLFKTQLTADGKILPSMADMDTVEGTTVTTYKYFTKSALEAATSEQDLALLAKSDKLLNNDYPPYFVEGAQKVRTVSAKESNYFNILQSIAETFQAWLTLEVTRDESGAILRKIARFKNYVGKKNYAGFRYGVNLKDIQRTFESNALVTKLIVKTNKNKYGDGGFCTIQRAGSNETGENFIYDLQYYYNIGLLDPKVNNELLYTGNNQSGEDITGDKNATWNVNNYFSRLKRINTLLKPVNEELSNTSLELVKLKAKKEVADAAVKAAASGIEETRNSFSEYTAGMNIESISFQSPLKSSSLSATKVDMNDTLENSSGKIAWSDVKISSISITQNASSTNNWTYKFAVNLVESVNSDTTAYFKAHPYVTYNDNTTEILKYTIPCELSAGDSSCNVELTVAPIDFNNSKIQQLLAAYAEYLTTDDEQSAELAKLNEEIAEVEEKIETLTTTANLYLEWKSKLNLEFYKRYSRFIAEGTWVDEKYSDDEKYYNDALSVLYNSCYPRTAYTINVAAIEGVEGYEDYTFDIGDQTYVFDPQFFGENAREPVIVAEITEAIDNPSAVQIKVQNFKNQFQDLFQKITATVQSVQYSTGAYEKAAALAEAGQAQKYSFLSDALEDAEAALQVAGQQTVVTDGSGITVHKEGNPREALRLVSGAILFSTEQDGEQKWKTGITPKGISADLVTAGQIDTGAIRIMNGKDETFKWDTNGITAYDYEDGALNKEKFVRLDRHGLYGVSGTVNGDIYSPDSVSQVDADATFALTWEGLKIKNKNNTTLRIGDGAKTNSGSTDLIQVTNGSGNTVFSISETGALKWSDASSPTRVLYAKTALTKPSSGYDWADAPNSNGATGDVWHKIKATTDWYATYTYNGGASWTDPIQFVGANTSNIKEWYYATSSDTETPLNPNDNGYTTGNWASKWKDSPTEAGHGAVKKYLWNYEETTLSNNAKIYTDPALISTQPKTVSKIYEFYIVTKSATAPSKPTFSSWNGTTLTYTNTNPAWEVVDTSSATSASTKTAAQSEYLWNFEVICYDDNTYSVGATANIGTGGKGISSIANYYQATSTEAAKPTTLDGGTSGSSWKTTISSAGQGATKPFLWTYEKTTYSNGVSENTAVSLLSRSPRTIKSITEYYKTIDNGAANPTTGITLGTNNNSISNYNNWSTTLDSPSEGESLWNVELIEFATKDDDGKNLYQVTAPARVGYVGVDSYTLSLDNDMDTIVQMSNGNWISGEVTVTATGYKGHTQKTGLSSGNLGQISLTAPSGWTANTHYTFTNNTLKFNPTGKTAPKGVPDGFTEGEFVFQWKNGDDVYAEKTFSLKKITSLADYDLVIPQVVYNSSQNGGTITINVLKKTQNGTQTLTSATTDTSIKLYQKSGEKYKPSGWSISYAQYREDEIYFVLTSADGELGPADSNGYAAFKTEKTPSIIWDEETVEFTQDGAGIKKIDTDVRNYPYALPAEDGQTYSYAWTTPKSGSDTAFVDIGHEEVWSCKSSHDNSHIKIGDTAYLVGQVADRFSATGEKQSITLYGVVTNVTSSGVTMKTSQVTWGGTKGDKGDKGDSAIHVELDNDTDIVTIANGNPIGLPITVNAKVYSGTTELSTGTWSISPPSNSWTQSYYSATNNVLEIKGIPSGFESGTFTFTWTPTSGSAITKKFALATVISDNDWNLIIDKSVVTLNGTDAEKTINIQVEKSTSAGSVKYSLGASNFPKNSSNQDEVYIVSTESGAYANRITNSSQQLSAATTYYLKQTAANGAIAAGFQWDVESVGAVRNGENGTSPYTISLDEDFLSIPCDKNGNFTAFTETITPTVYSGKDVVTGWATDANSATGFYLMLTSSNLTAAWDNSKVKVTNITADRGTFTLTLRKKGESTIYATTTFEAIKQKAGAPGEYVYIVSDYNEVKVGSFPDKIILSVLKRTSGTAEPSYVMGTTFWYEVSVDGGAFDGPYSQASSSLSITKSKYTNATKTIRINVYYDEKKTKIVDKVTIAVLKDGASVYALYHDAGTSVSGPTSKKYKDYATKHADGWYQGQTKDSVYMVSKIAQPDVEESTDWGPVARMVGTLTTNADILNALSSETTQGIYTYPDGSTTKIGINAQAIQTGVLRVGDPIGDANYIESTSGAYKKVSGKYILAEGGYSGTRYNFNPKINSVFYADMDQGSVDIAGWVVTSNSITKNSLGVLNGFHMYSSGYTPSSGTYFGQTGKTWMLGIGSNFGVTSNGELFATAGKIGTMTIGDINNLSGENLIKGSDSAYCRNNSANQIGTHRLVITKGGSSDPVLMPAGTYTLSATVSSLTWGSGLATANQKMEIGLYNNSTKIKSCVVVPEKNKRFTLTFETTEAFNYVTFYAGLSSAFASGTAISLKQLKLEQGTAATPWNRAIVDTVPTSSTGEFSWVFNSVGLTMYRNSIYPIFQANKDGLTIEGEIKALSGDIAGWGINATELVNGNLKLYGATNNKTTTSLIADGNSKVAIEAGQQTQTKTQQESVTIGSDWVYCTKQETEQSFEYTLSKEYDSVIILSYNPVAEAECPCGQGQVHYVTDRDVQMSCQYDKNTKKIVGKIVSNIFKVLEGGRYQTNIIYMGFYESETTEPTFSLLEDGSMYANAVRLQGLLKSGHVSFNSEESTTTFREPVSYKSASTFVYTGQPVFVTKFSLNDLSKEGTIERINNTSIDDYFSKTNDDDEVVYTIKSGVDFQLSPGDIFHYNKSLSDQSDLSITGFYMNNGVVETTSLGDVLLNGKSLTNTIAKLTQEVYAIKAKVGLL